MLLDTFHPPFFYKIKIKQAIICEAVKKIYVCFHFSVAAATCSATLLGQYAINFMLGKNFLHGSLAKSSDLPSAFGAKVLLRKRWRPLTGCRPRKEQYKGKAPFAFYALLRCELLES